MKTESRDNPSESVGTSSINMTDELHEIVNPGTYTGLQAGTAMVTSFDGSRNFHKQPVVMDHSYRHGDG